MKKQNESNDNNRPSQNVTKDKNYDRNVLISLVVIIVMGLLLGIFQPTTNAAINFDTTDSFGGGIGSDGTKLINSIKTKIRGTSTSPGSTTAGTSSSTGGTGGAKNVVAKTGGLDKRPIHAGSPEQQLIIDYIWNTYHDKTFLYLAKAENGLISPDRRHPIKYWCAKKKRWGYDWGLYGISDCYHEDKTSDPRFFTDWKWQVGEAYKLYKGGTRFYGMQRIAKVKKSFTWE